MDGAIRVRGEKVKIWDEVKEVGGGSDHTIILSQFCTCVLLLLHEESTGEALMERYVRQLDVQFWSSGERSGPDIYLLVINI